MRRIAPCERAYRCERALSESRVMMVSVARVVTVGLFYLVAICIGCGGDDVEKKQCHADCIGRAGESCLYMGDSSKAFYCLVQCSGDDACPTGQSCEYGACMDATCEERISVCRSIDGSDDDRHCYADCREGESCLFTGNTADSYYCVVECEDSRDCPTGQSCDYGASSCSTCDDIYKICQ